MKNAKSRVLAFASLALLGLLMGCPSQGGSGMSGCGQQQSQGGSGGSGSSKSK